MTRIVVLGTGGTIASRTTADRGAVASDSVASTLGPDLGPGGEGIAVETLDVLRENSFNFGLADLRRIAEAVSAQLDRRDADGRPEVDGVVVTHGTDVMEETGILLDLVHADDRPVVLTGAQFGPDELGADGRRNVRDAVILAAAPQARRRGVLICFAGTVFAARGVRKAHTLDPQPFAAQDSGPVGRVQGGAVRLWAALTDRNVLPPATTAFDETRVDLLTAYVGASSGLLDHAVDDGAAGVVLAGTGAGNVGRQWLDPIRRATERGVVVGLSTRVADGPVAAIYGNGGAVDAMRAGAVPIRALPGSQARILLALLLSQCTPQHVATALADF